MNGFTVRFRMKISEYIKFSIARTYKKRETIVAVLIGLSLLIFHFVHSNDNGSTPTVLFSGVGLILLGVIRTLLTARGLKESPYFLEELAYEVNDSGISIRGRSFAMDFQWVHFMKVEETSYFLILFQSGNEGLFFKKNVLNVEQLAFILSKTAGHDR